MVGIVGHMSGGKSYFAVEFILGRLFAGHVICTNIALKCQGVSAFLGVPCIAWKPLYYFLTDDKQDRLYHHIQSVDYEHYPVGSPRGSATYERDMVYILFDEASSMFDSLVHSSDAGIQAVATWARHSHKRGQEILLIMQFPSELHKRLRNHITEYIDCVNTSTIRLPLLGLRLPFFLRGLSLRQRLMSDGETPIGNTEWRRFEPRIYNCYTTAQIVVGAPALPASSFSRGLDVSFVRYRQRVFLTLALSLLVFVLSFVFCLVVYYVSSSHR